MEYYSNVVNLKYKGLEGGYYTGYCIIENNIKYWRIIGNNGLEFETIDEPVHELDFTLIRYDYK